MTETLTIRWRITGDPPREAYPGGPPVEQLVITVRGLNFRCGHPEKFGSIRNVSLEMAQEIASGEHEDWIRELGEREARAFAAEHDCQACATPTPAAAVDSP